MERTSPQYEKPESLAEKLRGIVEFPSFESPEFKFGHWTEPSSEQPGVMILRYFSPSDVGISFVKKTYDLGWVIRGFDWGTWKQTPEAESLRDDPRALAQATPEQLARLLTVCIRQDRFSEGALEAAFESGPLTRILKRAEVILREIEAASRR